MKDDLGETDRIQESMESLLEIIVEYEAGRLSQDQALKNGLKVIEGMKGLDDSAFQKIKLDWIDTVKGNDS